MELKNKTIVINGGTKGVGRGAALGAALLGANVVIGGRDKKDAQSLLAEIKQIKAEAIFVEGDVTDVTVCQRLFLEAEAAFGSIDGFVNYTGILPAASIMETEADLFDRVFDINIRAAFFCTKYAIHSMRKSGGGSIVYVGSGHAYGGEKDRAAYSCSKGALLTLSKHIAKNYAEERIRSNWVTMGWVATPGEMDLRHSQGHDLQWLEDYAGSMIPLGRLLTVDDHVPGILYLLSDDASMVTGTELQIGGGFMLP